MTWPDKRFFDLFRIELPIIQAPMANSTGVEMAVAVAEAGGLGSLPCGTSTPEQIEADIAAYRAQSRQPLNVNFFCHEAAGPDPQRERAWLDHLAPYFEELAVEPPSAPLPPGPTPFGDETCPIVEALRPEIVSFHFGLPEGSLLARVKAAGCKIICSATSLREASWLVAQGVDAIIAQGAEAGGHRGMFLETETATQIGTFALVRAISSIVNVPVIAAGGIADGRTIAAAFALGASAVQIGTAYLLCPEAYTPALHRAALANAGRETAITNVLTGRPARAVVNRFMREQGFMNEAAPAFPRARPAIAPLRAKAEAEGATDFSPLWSGQAAKLPEPMGAGDLTLWLADEALASRSPA